MDQIVQTPVAALPRRARNVDTLNGSMAGRSGDHHMDAARTTSRAEPIDATDRACAWCGSGEGRFVSRGFAGATDANDQFFECAACKRITFEILSQTGREMRLGRYKAGDTYQDRTNRTRYHIGRVLRVGANEFLLYLKPLDSSDRSAITGR